MDTKKLEENLINLGYKVDVFDTADQARQYLLDNLKNVSIGIGGSVTIENMNIYEELSKNNTVYWHWEKDELHKAATTDVYLSSVNGISEDGEIINIDGTCNRISSMLYGHKKVIFIFGINKIAKNFDEALYRARNIASVKNAIRLNKNTPCVKTGKCENCNSPDRICRGLSVLWKKPKGSEYEVIIIKEELGY